MKTDGGFTLIELAVALVVVTLILGGLLVPLNTQVEQRKISDTQKSLDEIKEALIGFAVAYGHLPCPATSATGLASGLEGPRTGGICTPRTGFVPWATLGTSKLDAWGNIFGYRVSDNYSSAVSPITFTSSADMTILTKDGTGAIAFLSNVNGTPAVVMSYGRNGYGSVNDRGIAQALPANWPANNADENSNATRLSADPPIRAGFVSRAPQAESASGAGGEFDDIVVWISPSILFNRMVAAGRLP